MTSEYVCEHKIRRLRYENTLKVQDAHSEHLRVHRPPPQAMREPLSSEAWASWTL